MEFRKEVFLRDKIPTVFEVGYTTPDGCDYVFVPGSDGGHLEYIFSEEISFDRNSTDRIETRPDVWYDVDGTTLFAKEIGPYERS